MAARKTVSGVIRRMIRGPQPPAPTWDELLQKHIVEAVDSVYAANENLFPNKIELPEKYGHNLPERAVELLLMRCSYKPGAQVLDVGFANIMQCQRDLMRKLPEPRHFTGIDIAKPVYDAASYYETMLEGSVADYDFAGRAFDLIWCISTMEHMGMDNSGYTASFTTDRDLDVLALQRMVSLLKPGGGLLLTVPYGRLEDHGWMRNYDAGRWQSLLERVRSGADIHEFYFRHTFGAGWAQVEPEELSYTGYYDQANAGSAGLAAVWIVRAKDPATPAPRQP